VATGKAERGVEVEGGGGVGLEKPVGKWWGLRVYVGPGTPCHNKTLTNTIKRALPG